MTINSPSQHKENLFNPQEKQFTSKPRQMEGHNTALRATAPRNANYPNTATMRKRRGRPPADPAAHERKLANASSYSSHAGGRNLDHMDENSLFGALRLGIASATSIADSWVERYKLSKDDGMLALIQFFISSSGCRGKVDIGLIKNANDGDIVKKMTEEFDEDIPEYPLMQSSPQWKRFKNNFIEFIQTLIKQCQYSIIYDGSMMEKLISFLTVLSDSPVRAFRHTGTLAALKLMSALVDVALNLSINWDNNQRQYEAEKAKGSARRGNERFEFLQRRRQELSENKDDVKNVLSFLFKSVFVHRYRDSQQEIRSICMQEIGVWMRRYPTVFLDDSYLKYIGWTLFDRVGDVRVQCLKALQPLYEDHSLVSALELFTSRFKSRLVDMTLDKDNDVAVQAVKLMICILKFNEAVLENKDCENIYELVYCTQRNLAVAAGEFLHLKLFDEVKAAAAQEQEMAMMSADKHKFSLKRKSPNIALFRDLVQFFIESELHEHAAYLVDSLWESSPMLRDWDAMLELLLLDNSVENSEPPLDSNQESALIEILCCCVRQSVTGLSPVGRQSGHSHSSMPSVAGVIGAGSSHVGAGSNSNSNQITDFTARLPVCLSYGFTALGSGNISSKELKILQEERFRMTNAMIPCIVNLLKKFAESHERITNLLQIPIFMDFDIYTSGRHERQLDLLLRTIQDIFRRHVNQECLLAVSKIFSVICQDELSIATKCQTVRATMVDQLIEMYKNSFLNYFKDDGDLPTEDETYHLKISMKKLDAFYSVNDLTSSELWASLFKIITTVADPSDQTNLAIGDKIDIEIICHAISICHNEILWRFQHLMDVDVDQEEIKILRERLLDLIKQCHALIMPEFHRDKLRKKISSEAFLCLSDLLVVFSRHLVSDAQPDPDVRPELMRDLIYEADQDLCTNLVVFTEKVVFLDEEDYSKTRMTTEEIETASIENLHLKRTQLAAFCKLVIYNLIPIKIAAPLYKHYIRSYSDFGDIMKSTLGKTREINRVHTARMIALCLQLGYDEIEQSNVNKKVERGSDGFQALKELARRLTLSFGLDLIKIREAMVSLHTESIQFCVRSAAREASLTGAMPGVPPNLLFLEIITEFSNKLLAQDKKSLSEYISRVFPSPIGEVWQSLHAYKASLDPNSVDENQVGIHLSALAASSSNNASNSRINRSADLDSSMTSMSSPKRRKLNFTAAEMSMNQTSVAPGSASDSVQSTPLHSHNTRRMQQINEISGAV